MDIVRFGKTFNTIVDNVNLVIHGKDDVVRLTLMAIVADGHVLFEDVPGVGKSMLATAFSRTIAAQTARVQCTPDMLPADITGSSMIEPKTMTLTFKPGPVFTNLLLVDEINRATPKTQSALLESMGEQKVSVDGQTHALPQPFVVLATQNPVEHAGTFPLPEAQLDRFLFKLNMGYPDLEAERKVVLGNALGLEVTKIDQVAKIADVLEMRQSAAQVEIAPAVLDYILELTRSTRLDPACSLGAGPRASIALVRAARVHAAADGRAHVYPEDVRALLRPVLAHRLILSPDAQLRGETVDAVLERVTSAVRPPVTPSVAKTTTAAAVNGHPGPADAPRRRRRAGTASR